MNLASGIIRLCLILSCLGCWLTRGQDDEKVDKDGENNNASRPVNIFIINEEENVVANKSIQAALKSIREKGENYLGKVWSVEISNSTKNSILVSLLNSWDAAVAEGGSISGTEGEDESGSGSGLPDFVLDTTRGDLEASVTSTFAAMIGVPTLSAQYSPQARTDLRYYSKHLSNDHEKYLIHVMPPGHLVPKAIPQLVRPHNLTNAAILSDHYFVIDRNYKSLQQKMPTPHRINRAPLSVPEMMELLRSLRDLGIDNYFILGAEKTLSMVLEAGDALNLTGREYGWFMLTLDDGIWPTWQCRDVSVLFMRPERKTDDRMVNLTNSLPKPLLSSGFYYDLTILGVQAMKHAIDNSKWPLQSGDILTRAPSNVTAPQRYFDFLSILKETYQNFTPTYGRIIWGNKNGEHHVQFNMSISLVHIDGDIFSRKMVGSWQAGILSSLEVTNETVRFMAKKVANYRVLTMINPPFIMHDREKKRWYGFCIDLLEQIRKKVKFDYEIRAVKPPCGKDGKIYDCWDEIIKDIIDNNTDIAIGTLGVTTQRERVVDFTIPFYDLVGFSIVMLKKKTSTVPFMFVTVLEIEVWGIFLVAYVFTSNLLWIFDRWSPYSYQNDRDKYKEDDEKPEFNLRACFWFCLASLTPQGGGAPPKNLSGRLAAATWWLFGFIIVASYTANLAAILTIPRLDTPIESLDDLSQQYKVEYAPVAYSQAYYYFKRLANIEWMFYNIWTNMGLNDSLPGVERVKLAVWDYPVSEKYTNMLQMMQRFQFPKSINKALQRLRHSNSKFAYIENSITIKYLLRMNCDLTQIGEDFAEKPYAIAIQQGSPLKNQFNKAILKLVNKRQLEKLKDKWWKKNPAQRNCDAEGNQNDGVSIRNIGGVFALIFMGIIFASFTLAFEYRYYRRQIRVIEIKRKSGMKAVTKIDLKSIRSYFQRAKVHILKTS